jgi:hypothetical protein
MGETNVRRTDHKSPRQALPLSGAAAETGAAGDPIQGADAASEAATHLTTEVMANLMIASGGSDELAALRHLLSVCSVCRGHFEDLRAKSRELRHWNLASVLHEAEEAPGIWNRIASSSYQRQLAAVRAEPIYQTWGFALFVLRQSGGGAAAQPERAAQLANLGLAVADTLDPAYDQDWIEDLAALALACLGNARREMGELVAANDAFDLARERRAAGTESPAVEAEIHALEAPRPRSGPRPPGIRRRPRRPPSRQRSRPRRPPRLLQPLPPLPPLHRRERGRNETRAAAPAEAQGRRSRGRSRPTRRLPRPPSRRPALRADRRERCRKAARPA